VEYSLVLLLNGISFGLLLFMLSSGLTLVFSLMGVLNFAHAGFYMLGAYIGYEASLRINFWAGLVLAPLTVGGIGMAVEYFGLRKVHRYGHAAELLFTFGLAFLIDEATHLIWGRSAVNYAIPAALSGPLFSIGEAQFPIYRGFIILISVAMLVAIWMLLRMSRIGLIIRGALTHPNTISTLGHDLPWVHMLVFGIGAALAGLAGAVGGAAFVTEPGMAHALGPIVFVVVVIGGLGSLGGAFVAALLIGCIQTFAVVADFNLGGILPFLHWNGIESITVSRLAPVLPYFLMILLLVLRPQGLMGKRAL